MLLCLSATPGGGIELSSASFRARAGHLSAAAGGLASAPSFSGAGGSTGQGQAVGESGALGNLTTHAGGFWPVVVGGYPTLDFDSDGIQAFFDPDDDNDGLDDPFETGTGLFVSATDTGSDPLNADSDGDGVSDGDEVAAGTDPNTPIAIPALSFLAWLALLAALAATAKLRWRRSA